MAQVRTYSQLLVQLQKARDKALAGVGDKAKDIVEAQIQKEVYDKPEGDYERTYGLLNSLNNFGLEYKGVSAQVRIGHNWQNMPYNPSNFQHGSNYWQPNDYRQYISETVHYGTSGNLFGANQPWHKAKPYMDLAKEEMKNGKYKSFMIEQLRGQGYTVR